MQGRGQDSIMSILQKIKSENSLKFLEKIKPYD
jgi:hypothetical protein